MSDQNEEQAKTIADIENKIKLDKAECSDKNEKIRKTNEEQEKEIDKLKRKIASNKSEKEELIDKVAELEDKIKSLEIQKDQNSVIASATYYHHQKG